MEKWKSCVADSLRVLQDLGIKRGSRFNPPFRFMFDCSDTQRGSGPHSPDVDKLTFPIPHGFFFSHVADVWLLPHMHAQRQSCTGSLSIMACRMIDSATVTTQRGGTNMDWMWLNQRQRTIIVFMRWLLQQYWPVQQTQHLTMTQGLFWEIVGGADKGGILVRAGKELKSEEKSGRLSHGALVREIEFLENGRLHYEIVTPGLAGLLSWSINLL